MASYPSHTSTTLLYTFIVFTALIAPLHAQSTILPAYNCTPTGSQAAATTPKRMSINFSHGNTDGIGSNTYHWLKYLNPTDTRLFVTSVSNWMSFVNTRKPQFGRSFTNIDVASVTEYTDAVTFLRTIPDLRNFLVYQHVDIRWSSFYKTLNVTNNSSDILKYGSNPESIIKKLDSMGLMPLCVWHVTCSNLAFKHTDSAMLEFWRERWELYRSTYLGARFFADLGVKEVELYNEPNLDTCLTASTWLDQYLIRGQAFQDAYGDAGKPPPFIIAPPLSNPNIDSVFGAPAILNRNSTFPPTTEGPVETAAAGCNDDSLAQCTKMHGAAYHQYNSPGYGMKSVFPKTLANVTKLNNNTPLPVWITEFSYYSGSKADESRGIDVMDLPSTAASIATQIADLIGGPEYINLFKLTQTLKTSGAGVAKNGILFANLNTAPYDVGSSSKVAEAHRMLLRAVPGGKKVYNLTMSPSVPNLTQLRVFLVATDKNYMFYVSNAESTDTSFRFNLSSLAGVTSTAPVIVSSVSSSRHGEVATIASLSSKRLTFSVPAGSFHSLTVPKSAVSSMTINATADTTLYAGGKSAASTGGSAASLTVQTLADTYHDGTSVSVLRFNTGNIPGGLGKVASAVLRLKILLSNNTTPQILTVFGVPSVASFSESSLSWDLCPALKPLLNGMSAVGSIANNFINWQDGGLQILGHVTVPAGSSSAGKFVQLDVTPYVASGVQSIMVARMYRKENRGSGVDALVGDDVNGRVSFYSREGTSAGSVKPALKVYYTA